MEFNVGSIGIAGLFMSIGAKPEEIDEALEILTMFPNPTTYVGIVQQAQAALSQLRALNEAEASIDASP